ncbi:proline--tRNA ligase [candidate division TM6 bacterium RIFCSPHIGHO2_12_FULL_36_22]|nr:MAG: proline--tRNA ligase [candidate division TM6 bacterium RIFCSPHIGHO2_12_FULL_36_22]
MNKLPDISKDVSQWYNEIVYKAELADQSPVRGCIVIRPYGWALWENIKTVLDKRIKETGHQNASFPLLIPESFIKREAKHVEGFAPELAIVTIAGGKELEEPLVVRPTSETIIHYSFARWIKSWRDLPLKINQWANVVRWEKRTRPFLRTTEFFWQEGHTAHATREEAQEEALLMLNEYINLAQDYLAIPVIAGEKSPTERFAGADITYTFEAIMMDGKALQMGTSHLLSRSFAKSFDIEYQDKEGNLEHPYLTSWGVTTRLIGAIVMTHGDQKGLVMPPRVAPIQVVIIPIYKKDAEQQVRDAVQELYTRLSKEYRVQLDADDSKSPGAKFYEWELKGVPLRIELGPRDVDNKAVMISNRVTGDKTMVKLDAIESEIGSMLDNMHQELFNRAQVKLQGHWNKESKLAIFGPVMDKEAGAYQTGWCGEEECENKLSEFKGTIRCLLKENEFNQCFGCNKSSVRDVLVAKAY